MEPNWLDILDDDTDDDDAPNPRRRDGTFRVYEFSRDASYLPSLLEEIAAWARECAEYQVVDLSISNEGGWTTGGSDRLGGLPRRPHRVAHLAGTRRRRR